MKARLMCVLIVLMLSLAGQRAAAQDIHFSQFTAAPLHLNPAFTGVNSCDFRAAVNYRNQWASVANFQTIAASYDMALGRKSRRSNYGGVGVQMFTDRAGDLAFGTTMVNFSGSYTVVLDRKGRNTLTSAIQAGIGHRSLNTANLTTDAQFLSDGFDPTAATGESTIDGGRLFADIGAGFLFSSTGDNNNFYGGIAVNHLNQPNLSLLGGTDELRMKATIHGGAHIKLATQFFLMPSFMFLNQGPHQQFTFGSLVKMRRSFNDEDPISFYLGAFYRIKDAIIINARMDIGAFNVGLSYDLNLSKVTAATGLSGAPELSLIYTGCFKKSGGVRYCPEAY